MSPTTTGPITRRIAATCLTTTRPSRSVSARSMPTPCETSFGIAMTARCATTFGSVWIRHIRRNRARWIVPTICAGILRRLPNTVRPISSTISDRGWNGVTPSHGRISTAHGSARARIPCAGVRSEVSAPLHTPSVASGASAECAGCDQRRNIEVTIMTTLPTSSARRLVARTALAALSLAFLCSSAHAADKPPLAPDTVPPFSTVSRISASIEFGLPALATEIDRDIPRRLATIDERVSCVHRRGVFFRGNAHCDIYGYVERTAGVSLYGRGDLVYGSVPIHGAIEGQGANRFTARIHGETEASATIEVEARPELSHDWSLGLNISDGFRWSEPPVMHVMGREIPLSKYAEPRIGSELGVIRERALAAARRLDLHDKAATAWRHAFEPIQLSDNPAIWLQLTPQNASFAGVRADGRVLSGSLELTGSAETVVGQHPAPVTATALPSLGH